MYFESIAHRSVPVASAAAAARLIRSRTPCSHDALIWQNSHGERIAAVADGGLDAPWDEVAVINLDTDRQLESITFAWLETDAEAILELEGCQDSGTLGDIPACCPLDGAGEDRPADFTCACCGETFISTIAIQRPFDQDEGFGRCRSCARSHPVLIFHTHNF